YVISTAGPRADTPVEGVGGLRKRRWTRYGLSVVVMLAMTAAELPMRSVLSPANLVMPYLMATVVIALRWGQTPGIVGCVSGAFFFDYSFIPPYFTFVVGDLQYVVTLLVMLAISLVTS